MRFSVARAFSWFPVSTSYRALSGSHCSQPQKTQACSYNTGISPAYTSEIYSTCNILTKHRKAKMKRGMVERPSSQRQPRLGITRIANRTSNTVPRAQNICKSSEQRLSDQKTFCVTMMSLFIWKICPAFYSCAVKAIYSPVRHESQVDSYLNKKDTRCSGPHRQEFSIQRHP